jgi:beta-galactosidase
VALIQRTTAILILAGLLALGRGGDAEAAAPKISLLQDVQGWKLQVDGRDFMVRGMNWGYSPIGFTYSYSLWTQPDAFIEKVLHREMGLLRAMGVNSIRQMADIPPRWVTWIYEHYQIYTTVNFLLGRYGLPVNGVYVPNIDYRNPTHRRAILDDMVAQFERFRETPGVLMWMLGNENNYGLSWTSFESVDLPRGEDDARAMHLYSLYGEAIRLIKERDRNHPITMANGDLQYLPLIAKYCADIDVLGSNVYRGARAGKFFEEVRAVVNKPTLFTEVGADAWNARESREDQAAQARYLVSQWQEIYEQSYGKGQAGNALGGFIFQWADGWWKVGQATNLSVHDTIATWPNAAYPHDFVEGQNNMNEEWFGIAAVEPLQEDGVDRIRPRAAYYTLQAAFRLDPYAPNVTIETVRAHFQRVNVDDFLARGEVGQALATADLLGVVRVSALRMKLEFIGSRGAGDAVRPHALVIDNTPSYFTDITTRPNPSVYARLSLNLVANAASNRLDPIFYENRGRMFIARSVDAQRLIDVAAASGAIIPLTSALATTAPQPLAIYQSEFQIQQPGFTLDGYYRTGHYHWGDEGDLFGLYREAYYGPNIDIYNGLAPFGAVLTAHRKLEGLKVAFGPELYWGANPTVMVKYRRGWGAWTATLLHQEDLVQGSSVRTSAAVPEPVTRRTTLALEGHRGRFTLQLGGIFAASQRVGATYTTVEQTTDGGGYLSSGYDVFEKKVRWQDTLGGKLRVTVDLGRAQLFTQGMWRGIVADGGPDSTISVTGWRLKESGRGNQMSAMAGIAFGSGDVQVAPKFLYQKPIVGPLPIIRDQFDPVMGSYARGVRPRNVLGDPFAVTDNRETVAGELLLTYDPTPATWFYTWDRDLREDAPFASSLDFVYRHQPTSRDSNLAFLGGGVVVPFNGAPPAHDIWEASTQIVGNPSRTVHLVGSLYVGQDQARGTSDRLVTRYGGSLRATRGGWLVSALVRFKDWGPYDYQRDFNLTFPFQSYYDLSYGLRAWDGEARFGLRGQYRTLNMYSEGVPIVVPGSPEAAAIKGSEYEIGTFMNIGF